MSRSFGDTVVLTIDFMMKFEESRARESSREHYGKRGMSVHGGLIKYTLSNKKVIKRLYFTVPEGDSSQNVKSALAHVDVIIQAMRNDAKLFEVKKLIILSDNACTYSSHVFHVAAFDIASSHGWQLTGIIHNESQDGKTELDSAFFHYKFQIHKYISATKGSVLTPGDMLKAMQYGKGLNNSNFFVILFDRKRLFELFDDKGKLYGKLKDRLKQALPIHLAEIRTTDNGNHKLYESSAHEQPFSFDNGLVKKIDRYMKIHQGSFIMGYKFFKRLFEENDQKKEKLEDLPESDGLLTGTTILSTCLQSNIQPVVAVETAEHESSVSEVQAEIIDDTNENDADSYSSSDSSDQSDSDEYEDITEAEINKIYQRCDKCGKVFRDKRYLELHQKTKINCNKKNVNESVEARGIRMMKNKLEEQFFQVKIPTSNINHVAQPSTNYYSKDFFTYNWAKRPSHGHTKGASYINADHKKQIDKFFHEGENNKGYKMSAALMLEAMISDSIMLHGNHSHPHPKHYLPYISEISAQINTLSSNKKKKRF